MFLARRVPPEARDAYSKDAMSGILGAVMSGMTLSFVVVIARYRLRASDIEIAFLSMAPVAGYLLSLVWANMMQGRRKMPFAGWSWVIARSLFFLVLFATCSKVFVGIVVLFWLISSVASPAYTQLMKEIYPDSDRARIMGYARVCTVAAMIVVTLVAGKIMESVSYRYVFPVAAAFGVASALVFNRIPAKEAAGEPGVRLHHFIADSASLLVRDKGYGWFCAAVFIFGFANFFATPACLLYEVDVLGVHEFRQSIYTLTLYAVTTLGYFYWGSRLDRPKPDKAVAWQMFWWAFIPLAYLVATQWWMLLPAKALQGFVNAGVDLVYLTGVIYFAPTERVSQYYAVFTTLMGIRGVLGPLLGGLVLQYHILSMQAVFVISAVVILASVGVQLIGCRKYCALGDQANQ